MGVQEHPGQVLVTHFGRYRDFGLYTDSLAFYGSRMFYYVWDLPIFVGMGAVGGLMGALFIKVNVKITQFRHLYIPVRYELCTTATLCCCWPTYAPGSLALMHKAHFSGVKV